MTGGSVDGSDDGFGLQQSEGYHALLQILRARTPADLLSATSRLCSAVVEHVDGGDTSLDGARVVAGPLSVGGGRLAELLRNECNELLLSNGKEVDLTALLESPGRLFFNSLSASAKRQKTGESGLKRDWKPHAAGAAEASIAAGLGAEISAAGGLAAAIAASSSAFVQGQAQAAQAPVAALAAALVPATPAQPEAEAGSPSSGGGDAPSHEAQLLDATLREAQQLPVMEAPLLVTFGCPIVGNASFVALQNAVVAPAGGLRIFNRVDPVASVGSGFVRGLRKVPHAGLPIELSNHFLLQANPLLNHLTYVIDSFRSIHDAPCSRACYVLPGLHYSPDRYAASAGLRLSKHSEHQAEAPSGETPRLSAVASREATPVTPPQ